MPIILQNNEYNNIIAITSKLSKNLVNTIKSDSVFFDAFDKIIIYYDNGQVKLTKITTVSEKKALIALFAFI